MTRLKGSRVLLLICAGAASPSACDSRTTSDDIAIYSAALTAPGMLRQNRGLALNPYLMSDSGTFEASGALPSQVVGYLKSQGIVREVCTTNTADKVPACSSGSAGTELRFSRPIPLGDTAVAIFVAQLSLRAQSDTSSLPMAFATAHRCVVARANTSWALRRCSLYMIT
jgi:hypothetical protein